MLNLLHQIALLGLITTSLIFATGCDRDPMIRVYEVEVRKPTAPTAADSASQSAPKRMIGAVLPAGESSIFLKMTGDPDKVATYFEGMKVAAQSAKLVNGNDVELDVAEGWNKGPGTSIAALTLIPPNMDGVDAPMTVTVLPGMSTLEEWKDYAQQNLDRWRGQLGLPSMPLADDLTESVQEIAVEGTDLPGYLVNYVGTSSGKPSMPPFAGGTMSPTSDSTPRAPDKQTSPAPATPKTQEKASTVKFELPEGWVDKTGEGSRIRLATIMTGSDADAAEVSVVMAGGEEKTIVELWAQSVLPPDAVTQEFIEKVISGAKPIQNVSKTTGKLYRIEPNDPTAADAQSILVAVFPIDDSNGERSLFAKLIGDVARVKENESKFEAFVQSLNWQ